MVVGIYFSRSGAHNYPLTVPMYRRAYFELSQELAKLGADMVIVRSPEAYLGKGRFKNHWVFTPDGELEERAAITVDTVYDKGPGNSLVFDDVPVMNSAFINDICVDKYRTAEMFREFSPDTRMVHTPQEYRDVLASWPDDQKVVIKPNDGFGGEGVRIEDAATARDTTITEQNLPLIIQSYIDTSQGIPGIAEGQHDLRLMVLNGEIIGGQVRQPAEGSFVANLSQGGSVKVLAHEQIPIAAIEAAQQIDWRFAEHQPRFYAIDLAHSNNRYYLIELNSRPGLSEKARGPEAEYIMKRLAKTLVA